jgi:phosphoribosylaminoimidazole-succinocarboxamide synthase
MEIQLIKMEHEGKAKRMWGTADPNLMVMEFKDSLTAFDAVKKGSFEGKGAINNAISAYMMTRLNAAIIPTHFVQMLDATRSLVRRVEIIPIEVIMRFEAAGSICARYGVEEGHAFDTPVFELGLKDDARHDPFFSDWRIPIEMRLASHGELQRIQYLATCTGHELRKIFKRAGIRLIDFKLEFGRCDNGSGRPTILLADEVTPDTCRLIHESTGRKLDKDLFRFDLGDIAEGYQTLLNMLGVNPQELLLASCVTIPAISGDKSDPDNPDPTDDSSAP